jgi:hypothetical protein
MMSTKTSPVDEGFRVADAAVAYNEWLANVGRDVTVGYIDAYEKATLSAVDFQETVAKSSGLDWIKNIGTAQADLTRELTRISARAARELVK